MFRKSGLKITRNARKCRPECPTGRVVAVDWTVDWKSSSAWRVRRFCWKLLILCGLDLPKCAFICIITKYSLNLSPDFGGADVTEFSDVLGESSNKSGGGKCSTWLSGTIKSFKLSLESEFFNVWTEAGDTFASIKLDNEITENKKKEECVINLGSFSDSTRPKALCGGKMRRAY